MGYLANWLHFNSWRGRVWWQTSSFTFDLLFLSSSYQVLSYHIYCPSASEQTIRSKKLCPKFIHNYNLIFCFSLGGMTSSLIWEGRMWIDWGVECSWLSLELSHLIFLLFLKLNWFFLIFRFFLSSHGNIIYLLFGWFCWKVVSEAAESMQSWAYWSYKDFNDLTTINGGHQAIFDNDNNIPSQTKVRALTQPYATSIGFYFLSLMSFLILLIFLW